MVDNSLVPWLALAGAGAVHGLNPASGWALAAVWGAGRDARGTAWRALGPLAVGHVAAIAVLALAVRQGIAFEGGVVRVSAWALLAVAAALHCSRRAPPWLRAVAGPVGLALGAFLMAGPQGAGLALVPAMMPLCVGTVASTGLPDALAFALAGLGLHLAAMLLVTGALAAVGARLVQAWRIRGPRRLRAPWRAS
ncbi:MAG: hypothetical protein JSR41_25030 [Proteobacteria bacterium]|nr:hypothetical protein [Pseudomonadota bacterium]